MAAGKRTRRGSQSDGCTTRGVEGKRVDRLQVEGWKHEGVWVRICNGSKLQQRVEVQTNHQERYV